MTRHTWARIPAVALPAAILLSLLSALPAHANWSDGAGVGTQSSTGHLSFADDTITDGTWHDADGSVIDPASDTLGAGSSVVYTVATSVLAAGDNLTATIGYDSGAQIPESIRDDVTLTVTSAPGTIRGSASDASGTQRISIDVRVDAADSLGAAATIDLSSLVISLTNGSEWRDTVTLDAGTISTATPAPGGTMNLRFSHSADDDGVMGFYLSNPAPGTLINWGLWVDGNEVVTEAKNGLNSMDYSSSATAQPYITIHGAFRGFGSPKQDESLIGALTLVNGWNDDFGSTSARYAFKDATHLQQVQGMPEGITDASYAFENAGSRSTSPMRLDGWKAQNATTMSHMFDGATTFNIWALQWSTSKVTDMSHMFDGATAFNADISSWDTSSVTTMAGMFSGASSFSRDLSRWNVSAVTDHRDFATGSKLTEAQLPVWPDADTRSASTDPKEPSEQPSRDPEPGKPAPEEPTTPEEPATPEQPNTPTTPTNDPTPAPTPDGQTPDDQQSGDPQPGEQPHGKAGRPDDDTTEAEQ